MTLRQSIQEVHGKTDELIKKLSDTTNQAVKTREGLFEQLHDELTRYVEIEETHLLPMLRKHAGTKSVASDALKGNKDLRKSLEKLSATPIDTDDFLAELDVLKKSFQKHVRNERQELLPAVLKAFSDEEASELATTIEDAVADADKVKRAEKREEAAQAKREEEAAEQAEAAERAAERALKQAESTAREVTEKAADATARTAAAVQDEAREVTTAIKERAQQVASDTRDAMTVYSHASQKFRDDAQAIKASSTVSTGAVTEIYSVWTGWFGTAARLNTDAIQSLMQCKSLQQVAEKQNAFATSAMRNWMESNVEALEIAQRTSKQAIGPLTGRLNQTA